MTRTKDVEDHRERLLNLNILLMGLLSRVVPSLAHLANTSPDATGTLRLVDAADSTHIAVIDKMAIQNLVKLQKGLEEWVEEL